MKMRLGFLLLFLIAANVEAAELKITSARLEIQSVSLRSMTDRASDSGTVTIQNLENSAVAVTLKITSSRSFRIESQYASPFQIPGNSWRTVKIYYTPDFAGAERATLSIRDGDNIERTLPLLGKSSVSDLLAFNGSFEFRGMSTTEEICVPATFRNTTSEPLAITEVDDNVSSVLQVRDVPVLPIVLLPNEHVVLFNLCVSSPNPMYAEGHGSVDVKYDLGGERQYKRLSVNASLVLDSNLAKPCITVTLDSSHFGPVIAGGTVTRSLIVKSNRYEPIQLKDGFVSGVDAKEFDLMLSSSLVIPPLGSVSIPVSYHPAFSDSLVKFRHTAYAEFEAIWMDKSCTNVQYTLIGLAIEPTDTATASPLISAQQQILAMVGRDSVSVKTFYFVNNTTTTFRIMSVELGRGASFTIQNISPSANFPFELAPQEILSVSVAMTGTIGEVYYDELRILTNQVDGVPVVFGLQGVRLSPSKLTVDRAKPLNAELHFVPGSLRATVRTPTPGRIQLTDILGNTIADAPIIDAWTIDLATLPSAPYFVRLTTNDGTWTRMLVR